jgi:hypothetical protein
VKDRGAGKTPAPRNSAALGEMDDYRFAVLAEIARL